MVSKFCIFVVWNSTLTNDVKEIELWIGFKILYLCGLKQSTNLTDYNNYGCELVSKFCIFVVWNSFRNLYGFHSWLWIGFKILYLCGLKQCSHWRKNKKLVVNWFQNFVSLWSETVIGARFNFIGELWIGFKILYLCGLKQSYATY